MIFKSKPIHAWLFADPWFKMLSLFGVKISPSSGPRRDAAERNDRGRVARKRHVAQMQNSPTHHSALILLISKK